MGHMGEGREKGKTVSPSRLVSRLKLELINLRASLWVFSHIFLIFAWGYKLSVLSVSCLELETGPWFAGFEFQTGFLCYAILEYYKVPAITSELFQLTSIFSLSFAFLYNCGHESVSHLLSKQFKRQWHDILIAWPYQTKYLLSFQNGTYLTSPVWSKHATTWLNTRVKIVQQILSLKTLWVMFEQLNFECKICAVKLCNM